MFNLPNKAQSITEVVGTSFQFYLSVIPKVFYLMAVIAVVAGVGHYLTMPVETPSTVSSGFSIAGILIAFITFLVNMALYAAALVIADKHAKGETISMNDAIQVAIEKVVPILVASIIVYIGVMIGSILLIIPGIFVAVLTSMYLPLIVLENQDGVNAIKGSCELIWGRWWHTFTVWLLAMIIPIILYFLASLAMVFLHSIIGLVANVIVYAVISPFILAVVLVLFRDLQLRAKLQPEPVAEETESSESSEK